MSAERVWSDLYGCPRALWTGLPGGHRWLVAAPPPRAAEVMDQLDTLRFKGSVWLIVTADLTPLAAALREVAPRGALVVGRTLTGGPALSLPARQVEREHLGYREGGEFPGWRAALPLDAPLDACAPASLCTQQGVPVVSAAPAEVARLLARWWAQTPHSLVPG